MSELQLLMNEISKWSDSTFGKFQRNPGIIYHLKEETDELIESIQSLDEVTISSHHTNKEYEKRVNRMRMEFADCLMLLVDSATHAGLSAEELLSSMKEKLEINKSRKWGNPDENGVIKHIKD